MVNVLQNQIFILNRVLDFLKKNIVVLQNFPHLEADFCKFIREERRNSRLRRAKFSVRQALLLIFIKQDMVRHEHLRSLRNKNVRLFHAALCNLVNLIEQRRNIECNAVSYHINNIAVKRAGRQQMKRKFSVIVHNRVTCVRAALKTDNYIRVLCEHIGDFTLALVAPVGSYNCSYHNKFLFSQLSFSISFLPIKTPITDAIISPLVQPLESPRQCRPRILVFKSVSILTRFE